MGKLSEEVKASRAKERAKKRAAKKKRDREIASAIHAQKVRRKLKGKQKKRKY